MQINQGNPCLANGQVQILFNLGIEDLIFSKIVSQNLFFKIRDGSCFAEP
ncbi:MAG: hypothetical protein KF734_14615 [Saprospiraceae bacterium]|nr:hypothetical protein [Saprospiraceae bacterium]